MLDLYPPITPYEEGLLSVGGGQRIFWESCGNPDGIPALVLHGGPGSGCTEAMRRYFDPSRHRIFLFDQRGCGRSIPLASQPNVSLATNTTADLISDMEQLRELHGVERWTLLGFSWGTTLGLAYAQNYPAHVEKMVLSMVTTGSRSEVNWLTEGVGRFFPREWERFSNAVSPPLRNLRLVDAYATMLFDEDPEVRSHAAKEWCAWEDAHISLAPGATPNPRYEDPDFRLRFARLVTHYWRHDCFLEDEQLMRNASLLNGIPGVLIHGRFDVSSPLDMAWRISKRWTSASLRVIDDAGHGVSDTFREAILEALNGSNGLGAP